MGSKTGLIYCRCKGGFYSDQESEKLILSLTGLNADIIEAEDLCALSFNEKDILNSLLKEYPVKVIIACYPRAVSNIFIQNGIEPGDYHVLGLKEFSPEEVKEALLRDFKITEGKASYKKITSSLAVPAWYPVIDKSRCILCGDCYRFCLFGVYRFDGKKIEVANPLSCKNNCPACGRNCVSSAIIFPRLKERSSLAGADVIFDDKYSSSGSDLIDRLNERNRKRPSLFREDIIRQAEEERRRAIDEQGERQ